VVRVSQHTMGRTREGMTLIEVLVVIGLLALATATVTFSIGALTRTKLRSACMRVAAASSFAYNRAISDGNTLRVVIDMEGNHLSLEEARGQVTLARTNDPRRMEAEKDGEAHEAIDPWEAAKARLEKTFRPSFGRSPFRALTGRKGETLKRYQRVPLGDGIRVVQMLLPHEREPRFEGAGAIYFFPSGMTEHAVIQLSDGGDRVYSVEIHPLTGRAKVHDFAYEPRVQALEEGYDELRDRR
jgi:general secretion pathway protein H